MVNCIDLPERDRLVNLLERLRACESLDDVPLALLAESQPDTRPSVKLVARYPDCRQVFRVKTSTRAVFVPAWKAGLTIVMTVLAASTDLTVWLLSVIAWPWLAQIAAWFLEPVVMITAGLVAGMVWVLYAVMVRMELWSISKGDLIVDLDELHTTVPAGFNLVQWQDVYTAVRRGNRRVWVALENGDILDLWLPTPSVRDTLVCLMRELIRLHHRDLHGRIGPEGQAPLPGAAWDRHLEVLEALIHKIPPETGFLTAPGLLFSAIAWLQSQMVRLLVVKRFSTGNRDRAPREYWYNENHWACLFPQLRDAQRESFTPVARKFRDTFSLSGEECQALRCLQCLRNMLAHGALSPYQKSEEDGSPMLVYLPNPKMKNNPCRQCPGYPRTDEGGVTVSFGPGQLRTYFEDLRTVGKVVSRVATKLDLKHEDLL